MLNGPSFSPPSNIIEHIVIFLHGYGASGDNLLNIAYEWAPHLPNTLFVAPNAPEQSDIVPSGYQWFGLPDFNPFNVRQGLDRATPQLVSYIKSLMNEHNVPASSISLVGFSQGTITALDTVFSDLNVGCIVGYSGAFYPPALSKNAVQTKTPIMLIHGTHDTVVPYTAMAQAHIGLTTLGIHTETHTCHGLEHSISQEGLKKGLSFIQKHVKQATPS